MSHIKNQELSEQLYETQDYDQMLEFGLITEDERDRLKVADFVDKEMKLYVNPNPTTA